MPEVLTKPLRRLKVFVQGQVLIPDWVEDLESFRRWRLSEESPDQGTPLGLGMNGGPAQGLTPLAINCRPGGAGGTAQPAIVSFPAIADCGLEGSSSAIRNPQSAIQRVFVPYEPSLDTGLPFFGSGTSPLTPTTTVLPGVWAKARTASSSRRRRSCG